MTSFGWKRKAGENVSVSNSRVFENLSKDPESVPHSVTGPIDWVKLTPKRRCVQAEDDACKSKRLYDEGIVLAETDRYWEAIKKWNEAIRLTPANEKLYEMKSQALMILHEDVPAIQSAEQAVAANPKWWVTHQTLGRALLNYGEVLRAVRSFSKALHLQPDNHELRTCDLEWTVLLSRRRVQLDTEIIKQADSESKLSETSLIIEEIPETLKDCDSSETVKQHRVEDCSDITPSPVQISKSERVRILSHQPAVTSTSRRRSKSESAPSSSGAEGELMTIPDNYIQMRDV